MAKVILKINVINGNCIMMAHYFTGKLIKKFKSVCKIGIINCSVLRTSSSDTLSTGNP